LKIDSYLTSQEIRRIFTEPDGSLPHSQVPIPILMKVNPVLVSPSHVLKIYF